MCIDTIIYNIDTVWNLALLFFPTEDPYTLIPPLPILFPVGFLPISSPLTAASPSLLSSALRACCDLCTSVYLPGQ